MTSPNAAAAPLDSVGIEAATDAASALVTAALSDDFDSFNAILAELGPDDVGRRVVNELVGIVLHLAWWIHELRPGQDLVLVQEYALVRQRQKSRP